MNTQCRLSVICETKINPSVKMHLCSVIIIVNVHRFPRFLSFLISFPQVPLFEYFSFFCQPPFPPVGGTARLLAAQSERPHGAAELLPVPHCTLPLHVLGVWSTLRPPCLHCAPAHPALR